MNKHEWTYKIVLEYLACKECGYVIESREDYKELEGRYIKELTCPRCKQTFIVEKK